MLLNSTKYKDYLEYLIMHDLKLLDDWFKANHLSLNLSKTVLMNVWQKGKIIQLELDKVKIPTVTTTKFLGVYLDNQLNWKYHTTSLYNKIQSNKYLLSTTQNLLDKKSLRSIYYAHIYSHLSYSISTWGSMILASDQLKRHKAKYHTK